MTKISFYIDAATLKEHLSYDPETGVFVRIKKIAGVNARTPMGTVTASGYLTISVRGNPYKAHRLAWLYVYGKWPDGVIDHINGIRTDNRIANLRDVAQVINIQNVYCVQKNSVTGYRGVHKTQYGTFFAKIRVNGVDHCLGTYKDPKDAAQAYMDAKKRLHVGCGHMA